MPGALMGLLLSFQVILLFKRLPFDRDSWIIMYVNPLIGFYTAGFAYMAAGILIAPARTRIVALILSGGLLTISIINLELVQYSKEYFEFIKYIAAAVGAAIAYFSLKDVVER